MIDFENTLTFCSSELCLDFGSSNRLQDPHCLSLIVTNTSTIPAQLSLSVKHFPANATSHLQCNPTDNSTSKPRYITCTIYKELKLIFSIMNGWMVY